MSDKYVALKEEMKKLQAKFKEQEEELSESREKENMLVDEICRLKYQVKQLADLERELTRANEQFSEENNRLLTYIAMMEKADGKLADAGLTTHH